MKKIIILIIFQIICNYIYSQSKDSLLLWGKNLEYNSFLGEKKDSTQFQATSNIFIEVLPVIQKNDKYIYYVFCFFDMNKSFITKESKELLEHEQLHFDIAELISRKLRLRYKSLKEHSAYLNIYYNYMDTLDVYQNRYDKETVFSIRYKEQKKWKEKIKKELNELKEHSFIID